MILALKMIPVDVIAECRMETKEVMAQGKTVNKIATAAIILIWVGMAGLAVVLLYRHVKS